MSLSRRSSRTGEWKSLLDSCPLCAIDSKSNTGSVCSQRLSEEGSKNRFDDTTAAPVARQRGRNKMPPPPPRRSRSSSSGGSRVRFQPAKEEQSPSSATQTRAKSVLRASPRYKVSQELMQQQLDDSVKVTTMSMDMDISMEFSTYDDEASRSGMINNQNEEKLDEQTDRHAENDKHADDVKVDEVELPFDRLPSSPLHPQSLQKNSDEASTRRQDDEERGDVNKSGMCGRRTYQQVPAVRHRPDPEESLCDESSSCGSQISNQVYRSQQNYSSQFQSCSSQRLRGRQELGVGGHRPRSRSTSSSISHRHQEHQPSRLPEKASSVSLSQVENTKQSLQSSPGSSSRLNHHHNHRQQPLYPNMVISPVPKDDEMSELTFMGHSVRSSSTSACPNNPTSSIGEKSSVTDNTEPAPVPALSMIMTDTNKFDPKSGRCIHHPQVRLRKKKLFGKGWKVLMSACPDCCVGELRRIRLAEENSIKLALETKEKIDRCSRQLSDITDDSDAIDSRTTNSNSNRDSINRGGGDEGETLRSRRRSSSRSRSRSIAGTDPKKEPSTKMTQPLPPRRFLLQDVDHGPQTMPPKKVMMHLETDDTTASLTGSSKGSFEGVTFYHSHPSEEEDRRSHAQHENRGTIHVRQMRWKDPKNGQSGNYTGQVNARFVPHGRGVMEYDPNPNNDMSGLGVSVVLVKEGEWRNGRFRRDHHCSRGNTINNSNDCDSRNVKCSSSGSIGTSGNREDDGKNQSSSQSKSKARVLNCDEEPRRSRSFHGTSQRQQRQRSLSRSAKQDSF
ncbi:hypothetical protein ACHAXA_003368 [Cyclostephanos tholiformis]|uniref:Uncharacterized protein n=1 Tax=Cyclostephanos tholiformis TaxID=382380 RepID=A0ABD3R603_9STRA